VAKTFRDAAIGIFFLVLAGVVGLGLPGAFNFWKEAQSKQLEVQTQIVGVLQTSVDGALSEIANIRQSEADQFAEIKANAEKTSRFLEEASILAGVRFLEDGRVLSPATADEMAREAIKNIRENHSERIGEILEAVNDTYLRQRQ